MGWGQGYPIPDGYGNRIINFNSSGIGYGYGDILGSRGKGLGRQYPYSLRPIAMSSRHYHASPEKGWEGVNVRGLSRSKLSQSKG